MSQAFSVFLSSLAFLLGFFVFIFYSTEVNQLPGYYKHFICCSVELIEVPHFRFISLTWLFCFYLL